MNEELLLAIKNGDIEKVKQILGTHPMYVNGELFRGRMAIHYAADYNQQEVIKYLVKNGSDINQPDRHGITALLAAIWESHVESVDLLLKWGAKKDGKSPEGKSYIECAEDDKIKELLSK